MSERRGGGVSILSILEGNELVLEFLKIESLLLLLMVEGASLFIDFGSKLAIDFLFDLLLGSISNRECNSLDMIVSLLFVLLVDL